jgi:ketosteroid isomerase-like protein
MSLAAFDDEALRTFTRAFEDMFYAGDAAAMTAYYTRDAQLMADGMRPVRGHVDIEAFWGMATGRANAAGARRGIEMHEWSSSGDLGYALCTVTVELPTGTRSVWDTTVWRRDTDGRWRIAVDISSPLPTVD